jgi:hypothetical protein
VILWLASVDFVLCNLIIVSVPDKVLFRLIYITYAVLEGVQQQ